MDFATENVMSQEPGSVATAPPPMEGAPATEPSIVADATSAYERYDFPAEPAVEEAPASPPAQEAPPPAAETPPPAEPSEDEFTAEQVALIERALSPRGKRDGLPEAVRQRIDQLVSNRYGNQLQTARAEAERAALMRRETEEREWAEHTDIANRLSTDSAYRAEMVRRNGEPAVLRWEADYKERAAARSAPVVDTSQFQQEFSVAFNNAAIEEFRGTVKEAIPFFGDLPEETRNAIDRAKYDPNGNWFADSLDALGKGIQAHIASIERRHATALEEARQAGRNEAVAEREEGAPVRVEGAPANRFSTFRQAEAARAAGQISSEEFARQRAIFGITY